jgi:hypothetical protein
LWHGLYELQRILRKCRGGDEHSTVGVPLR